MVVSQQTPLNERLLCELRALARRGATAAELVAHVRGDSPSLNGIVPVLAYLCRAFSIPLPLVLPLREDEGTGAFGKAVEVLFWFSALLTAELHAEPWDWDRFWKKFPGKFSANEMESIALPSGSVSFTRPSASSRDVYARAVLDVYIDKLEAFGPGRTETFEQVRQLASTFRDVIAQAAPARIDDILAVPMKFEFQIEEQGPKHHVVCMAQALRESRIVLAASASSVQ